MGDLTWAMLEPSFTHDFCRQLKHVYFCGNYGDPLASNEFMEIVENFVARSVNISIFTNASLRNPAYFSRLAEIIGRNGKIVFAIDGLEDTNPIYRVNSNWKRVMENAKAFIDAGGRARWDYLVFKHNAHQVEEARNLAKQMGFETFKVKKTTRFVYENVARGKHEEQPVVIAKPQKSASVEKKVYAIEPADNTASQSIKEIKKEHGSFDSYIAQTDIRCKTALDKSIYIDFTGNIWPCCWMGSSLYDQEADRLSRIQLVELKEKYGEDFNRIKPGQTLQDIMSHQFFAGDLVDSWTDEKNLSRRFVCGFTCGTKFEASTGASDKNATTERL